MQVHTIKQGDDDLHYGPCAYGPCCECYKEFQCEEWLEKSIMKMEYQRDELRENI